MKEHFINLLLEQYKQECLFEELEQKGLQFGNICVDNLAVVLDFLYLNTGGEKREENKKIPDDEMFCRDWLDEKYFEITRELFSHQYIFVTDKGLQIEKGAGLDLVLQSFDQYIDWLYEEYEKFKQGIE